MKSIQAASAQRVSSNAGRDNEKVLAEFAYQPAAEGKRQNGEAKSVSKPEVMQLVQTFRVTVPKPLTCQCLMHIMLSPGAIVPSRLVLRSISHRVNLLLCEHGAALISN